MAADEWFWTNVKIGDPGVCWPWLPRLDSSGYGQVRWPDGRLEQAHRVAVALTREPLGVQQGDHTCHEHTCREGVRCPHRACCNPGHVRSASARENTLRGNTAASANMAKDLCPAGHHYDVTNTYVHPDGSRTCRSCQLAHKRRYNAKHATGRKWTGKPVFTVADVQAIRASDATHVQVAGQYGVTPECIRSIRNRRTWGWVS